MRHCEAGEFAEASKFVDSDEGDGGDGVCSGREP